ncbi:MAG: hypothetical protein IKM53_05145 [Clostridia bacterium]|nr:hypothetical protein [Clostridia bacterium]
MDGSNREVKRRASAAFWKKPFVYLYAVFMAGILVFAVYRFFGLVEAVMRAFTPFDLGHLPYLTVSFFVAVPVVLGVIRFFAFDVSMGGISVFEMLYYFSSGKRFGMAVSFCLSALIYLASGGLFPAVLFAVALRMEGWLSPLVGSQELTVLCVITELAAFASLIALFVRAVELVNASFVFVRFEQLGAAFAFEQAERFSEGGASLVLSFWLPCLVLVLVNKFLLLLLVPYFLLSVMLGFESRRSSGFTAEVL